MPKAALSLKATTRLKSVITLVITVLIFAVSIAANVFSSQEKALAATLSTVNFQARLMTGTGGIAPDGNYNVEFKLYDVASGGATAQGVCTGNCKWVETRTSTNQVRVANGYLTVNLGSVTSFGSINWDQDLWVTMNIGGTGGSPTWDGEMGPRLKLTAVPYAFRAGALAGGTGSNTTVLDTGTPSGTNTIHLPAESGTLCIQSSANCGFATGTAGSYIQNGTSQQTATYNIISGSSGATTALIQGASSGTVPVTIIRGGATPGSGEDLLQLQDSSSAVLAKFDNTGKFTTTKGVFINDTNDASAFVVQGSSNALLTVDTAAGKVWVGNPTDCSGRFCVTNTVTGSGGSTFTNAMNNTIATVTSSASTFIGQEIDIDDDSSAIANTIRGVRIDTSGSTNTSVVINGFHLKTPSTIAAGGNFLLFDRGSNTPFKVNVNGDTTIRSNASSATALQVQNTSNNNVFQVSTNGDYVAVGNITSTGGAGVSGKLRFADGTNDNLYVQLQSATVTTSSKTITLPDATGTVCLDSGNCDGSTSTGYILNQSASAQSANFFVRSKSTSAVTGVLQGASGQTADLLDVQTWNGTTATTVFSIGNTGALTASGGAIQLNVSSNNNTSINTGSSTGTVSIGNGAAGALSLQSGSTIAVATTNFNVSTAGVVTLAGAQTADITTASGTTGNGITILPGTSSGSSSNGGSVTIKGSNGSGTSSVTGGSVTIQGGNATGASGTRTGGSVTIDAGTSAAGAANNGTVSIGTTNATTVTLGGGSTSVKIGVLGAATATSAAVCRDTSTTSLTACDANTSGRPFLQGGNTFGAIGQLGTNDNFALQLQTNGVVRGTFDTSNGFYFGNGVTAGTPNNFTVAGTGSSTAGTTGATLTIQGGAGASATTGSAGGQLKLQGGNAGGSGNNAGGDIMLTPGTRTGTGAFGSIIFRPAASNDSTSFFQVQNAAATGNALVVDTNGKVGINLSVGTAPAANLEIGGALRLSSTVTDSYVTPVGTSITTKINIPNYNPGQFNQLVAMGLPSGAHAQSRAISLLDARTGSHDPTIAVFSPDENNIVGFSWNGSNTIAAVETSEKVYSGGTSSSISLQSGNVAGGSGNSGDTYLQSGTIAGGSGNTTGTVYVLSGNGSGTNASSGNVTIDVGTATGSGTKGAINVGITNAATINIGGASTTVKVGALGAVTSNSSVVCRDTSTNALTACDANGTGARPFIQGGNTFAATGVLGTNDSNNLQFETNNTVRATFDTSNGLYLGNGVTAGTPNNFTLAATGSSNVGTAGANLSIQGGAGIGSSTGSAGGNVTIAGGNAGGSGNNAGGIVTLQGGSRTGTGAAGGVLVKNLTDSTTAFRVQNAAGTSTVFNVDTSTSASTFGGAVYLSSSSASRVGSLRFNSTDNTLRISTSSVGNTSNGTGATDSGNVNMASASKFNSGTGGQVNALYVYFPVVAGSPNNKVKAGIYSDNGSGTAPTSLLANSDLSNGAGTAVTAGSWTRVPLTTTYTMAANTTYWLAFNVNSGSTTYGYVSGSGGDSAYNGSINFDSTGLPSSFTVNSGTGTNLYSIYAPYLTIADESYLQGAIRIDDNNNVVVRPNYNQDESGNLNGSFEVQTNTGSTLLSVNTATGFTGFGGSIQLNDTNTNYNLNVAGQYSSGTARIYRTNATTSDNILSLFSDVSGTNTLKLAFKGNGDITESQASTWSTTAGVLTLQGAGGVTINTPTAAAAGAISIAAGITTNSNGTGANASFSAGDANSTTCGTACTGGAVTIQGGSATGASGTTRNGGNVTLNAGTGATANGQLILGSLTSTNTITIGNATTANGATQTVNIATSGTGTGKAAVTVGNTNGASTLTLQAGTGNATGDINIGDQTTASKIIHIGSVDNAGTGTTRIATGAAVQDVAIGSTNGASTTRIQAGSANLILDTGGTARGTFDTSGNLYLGNGTSNNAPSNFTVQGTASSLSGAAGANLSLQGGAATTGNANGGNLILAGGVGFGTGVRGAVQIGASAGSGSFVNNGITTNTVTTQSTASGTAISNVDLYSAFVITVTNSGQTMTLADPSPATAGRTIYISNASSGSNLFTLAPAHGSSVSLNTGATATLLWNGSAWTYAGADASSVLNQTASVQVAGFNIQPGSNVTAATITGAASSSVTTFQLKQGTSQTGSMMLITDNSTNAYNLLTVASTGAFTSMINTDSASAFQIQNASGATQLSLDTTNTSGSLNVAVNGGGETSGTFATNWTTHGTSTTISRDTTAGEYASGVAGVKVAVTAGTTTPGVRNNVGTAMSASTSYVISFSVKVSVAMTNANMAVVFSPTGTTANNATCTTMSSSYGSINTSTFVKYTCTLTTTSTTTTSSAYLALYQGDATLRNIFIDNLSIVAQNSSGTQNTGTLRVGGASSQGLTLITLDTYAGNPFTGANASLAGSMYFDTSQGKIQCYDGSAWGACGAAPNTIVTLTPEYAGAVLHGTPSGSDNNIGTLTSDFCGNGGGLSVNTGLCASGEARNFYNWTSPQSNSQTYTVYVTYKLPSTFKNFINATTTATGRVDNTTNGGVAYAIYKSTGGSITSCSASANIEGNGSGTINTWLAQAPTTDPSTCTFAANNNIIFAITVTSKSNANAYLENLNFTFSNQ